MPSPFPGMDPYLQDQWSAVHVLMMAALSAGLKRVLPAGLVARPEETVRIESTAGDHLYDYRPDLTVAESGGPGPTATIARTVASVTVTPGLELEIRRDPIVTRNVQIVDRRNADRVVTVIEVLSPGNKDPGTLNEAYRRKLNDYEATATNWVEIDLLRSSRCHLPVPWDRLPAGTPRDYLVLAYRSRTGRVTAYPIGVRDRLPTVAVPLRTGDADAPLDLQAVFDRAYDDGPFAEDAGYARPTYPPLSDADAAWASELLASRA